MATVNTNVSFSDDTQGALDGLLNSMQVSHWRQSADVRTQGEEPAVDTVHRLAAASAAASGAVALGAARRWFDAGGGRRQLITLDALQSLCGLCPLTFQRQSGCAVPIRLDTARELKAGFYRTADDRWFFMAGAYSHLRDLTTELLNCPNTQEALASAVARRESWELEETFAANGATGAVARTREEWEHHPQGRLLVGKPVVEVVKIADGPPEHARPCRRPLDDLRVLDLSHVIAGPVMARSLGEHGAEVLRISSTSHPDSLFQILDTGIGKRNAYIDLDVPADMARLHALIHRADVFVQSWRPGSMERRGLGPDDVVRMRPGIVYVSVSAYGFEGPWAGRKGFDPQGQSVSGIAMSEAVGGRPRLAPTHLLNDYLTAYLGAFGTMVALDRREREGGSYHVKVSLVQASMWVQSLGLRERPQNPQAVDTLHPVLRSRESAFGVLEQMDPVAAMSETPPHWTLPPAPLGSSAPVWMG